MEETLIRQLAFIRELDKMKTTYRRSPIYQGGRRENDAEHSWHIAVMAMVLYPQVPEPKPSLDVVLRMLLVHDLIEIYAGDTFAYDVTGNMDKQTRERAAADRLFALLPMGEGNTLQALWEEFDAMETPESLYANAVDRIQPFLANAYNNGITWIEGKVCRSQVLDRMEPVRRAVPAFGAYIDSVIQESIEKGYLRE